MCCEVGSIRQIHRRLRQEGFCIGEAALRLWVKDGTLPAVYTGNKALISYNRVLEILMVTPSIAPLNPVKS